MSSSEHANILLAKGVEAWNKWRQDNPTVIPTLSYAFLNNCNLSEIDLHGVHLVHATLSGANLYRADLRQATLLQANLYGANLEDANLCQARLNTANLTSTRLAGADLSEANLLGTVFGDVDLSGVRGLETVVHRGPSIIGIDTIYRSRGEVPEVFLRGAGVPEEYITYARSLANKAIEFYSCFISHSHKDEEFAKRLHSRMRESHLRVWFAPEDIKSGQKIHEQIERAIQVHDRLLLVLSENSMQSEWVMTEIRNARRVEIAEKRRKLFPIRIADFKAIQKWKCFDSDSGKDLAVEAREYFIPDFSNWKDQDSFEKAFDRLLRDLKAEETT